jgi:hypothetical protein
MKTCPKCGTVVQDGDKFCNKCAVRLTGQQATATNMYGPVEPPKKKASKGLKIIAVIIVVIIALAAIGAALSLQDEGGSSSLATKSAAEMIMPLGSMGDGWLNTTTGTVPYMNGCTDSAEVYYSYYSVFGGESLEISMYVFANASVAKAAYDVQRSGYDDQYSLSSADVGSGSFEYSIGQMSRLCFYDHNVLVMMLGVNTSMSDMEGWADKQCDRIE